MQRNEIETLLGEGAEALDISPSMFKEASAHYEAMGSFLESKGIQADVSPVGSIVMGTIIRPHTEDDDGYFDIDVLVERTDLEKSSCTELDVREPIEDALASSGLYGDKIEACDTCITLRYVWNGREGGFRLDLDACIANITDPNAVACTTYPEFADSAIAIARRPPQTWLGSNPKGLCNWFLQKNDRFACEGRGQRKRALFESGRNVYASIEDIPDALDRSSLQRAIQVLKRSRDIYYDRCGKSDGAASFILAIMCANLSDSLASDASVLEILERFIESMDANSPLRYNASGLTHDSLGWHLSNPVYGENVLRDWTPEDAALFFLWIAELKRNLDDLKTSVPVKNQAASEALFGKRIGGKIVRSSGIAGAVLATPTLVKPTKPWGLSCKIRP